MARKRRLDAGGFAFGHLTRPAAGQDHRDVPLGRHGRIVWRLILGSVLAAIALTVVLLILAD